MKLKITVHGVAYEVEVEVLDAGEGFAPPSALPPVAPRAAAPAPAPATAPAASAPKPSGGGSRGSVNSPIAGTVVEIRCGVGDTVEKDQVLLVVDAMKMHTSIASPLSGKVASIKVAVGDAVRENQALVEID